MSYISAGFMIMVAITAILYYVLPKRWQWCVLLVVSILFYATYGFRYMGYIITTIISSYFITIHMVRYKDKHIRKRWLIAGLLINFGILFFMKYTNFLIGNVNSIFTLLYPSAKIPSLSIVMPLGISFYTFQTMSYVIDVYQKKYEPERNIFKLALFTSFFPQLLQGPIGRFDRLAPQFFKKHEFDIKNVEYGVQRIGWGLAKKLVLADRAAVISNTIFSNLNVYSGVHIVAGMFLYSIYIYCDFSGGVDVVIGVAEIFGIRLDENFIQPYFSKSIGDFWRRWHITLGTWMKDYIFYPFSISKRMLKFGKKMKKKFGTATGRVLPICVANILIFFIVGVWHGANWKYIMYGFYNGIIIASSNLLKPQYAKMAQKCHINLESRSWKGVQIIRTFILINIGWLFDACSSFYWVVVAFLRIFVGFRLNVLWDGSMLRMGLGVRDWKILLVGTIILLATSIMKERGIRLRDFIAERPLVVRWAIYLALFMVAAPFGYVGTTTEFIYAQF